MPVHGTRKTNSRSSIGAVLVFGAILVGYMVYTGTYNPIAAIEGIYNMVLGVLPGEISGLIRQAVDLVFGLINRLLRELQRLL